MGIVINADAKRRWCRWNKDLQRIDIDETTGCSSAMSDLDRMNTTRQARSLIDHLRSQTAIRVDVSNLHTIDKDSKYATICISCISEPECRTVDLDRCPGAQI